jgi:hypothetical protein
MDGLYMWDNPNTYGGEFNVYPQEYTQDYYIYGNNSEIDNSTYDWLYIGYWQVEQNKDIVSANTSWIRPQVFYNGAWTSDTDANNSNYPVMLYNKQAPLSAYKLSADGTEALVIMINPFNNGYTKETFKIRLQTKDNQEFDIDLYGNYTTVVRIKNITPSITIPATVQLKLSSNAMQPCTTNNPFVTYYLLNGDTVYTIDGSNGHTVYQDYACTIQIQLGIYTDGIYGFQLSEGGNYDVWTQLTPCP